MLTEEGGVANNVFLASAFSSRDEEEEEYKEQEILFYFCFSFIKMPVEKAKTQQKKKAKFRSILGCKFLWGYCLVTWFIPGSRSEISGALFPFLFVLLSYSDALRSVRDIKRTQLGSGDEGRRDRNRERMEGNEMLAQVSI